MWKRLKGEDGRVDVGGILMLGISMIFVAVGFIIFPIVIAGAETSRTADNVAQYTGLTEVIGISPVLVLVGFLAAAVVTGFMGIKRLT